MGLSIYPGGHSIAYPVFGQVRRKIAAEYGIDIDEMRGFGGETFWPEPDQVPPVFLLNHPDNEGFISSWECEIMLPSLRIIKAKWEAEGASVHYYMEIEALGNLIDSMEICVAVKAAMQFQ